MVRTAAFKSCSKVISSSFRHSGARVSANPESRANHFWIPGSLASLAPRNDVLEKFRIAPSISPHTQPERVLHDAQADLAAERHQRFRMKLHAADRQALVLDRHGDAVLGACGYAEHVGHAVALDIERMVAADH